MAYAFFLVCSFAVMPPLGAQTSAGAHWVGSWAASQQLPEPQNSLAPESLRDSTLREVVHLSLGGGTLRVRLSNAFGTAPLHLFSVHIARPILPSAGKIDPATDRALSFSGSGDVTIPAGADYVSDAIEYPVAALSDLAISIHYDVPPVQQTGHPGSRATSYVAVGDKTAAADLPLATRVEHWYQLSEVDVISPAESIVVLGDSITDGHGATVDQNNRWTDVLAQRLNRASGSTGVLNEGIGGNHLLTDGLGPNALARFDRDVLAPSAAGYLIVLEGVNDLGGLTRDGPASAADHDALVHRMIAAYSQIIVRARARGIKVIGATILPYTGSDYYHPGPESEADRQKVNFWIRGAGHFDAVVDFDKIMSDPQRPIPETTCTLPRPVTGPWARLSR
jgi:lysophospholipase L1-like esterase